MAKRFKFSVAFATFDDALAQAWDGFLEEFQNIILVKGSVGVSADAIVSLSDGKGQFECQADRIILHEIVSEKGFARMRELIQINHGGHLPVGRAGFSI